MDHSDDSALPGRLVLLTTTHRIAPGLLSWPAWELLRAADLVVCPDPGNPQLPYLREAGVAVEPSAPTGRELVDLTGGGRTVVYLAGGEGDRAVTDELSRLGGSGRVHMPDLELLPGSYDLPGARLLDLVQVMDRIRRECPWSSVRTTEELVKYGIEEVYELAEAAEEETGRLCARSSATSCCRSSSTRGSRRTTRRSRSRSTTSPPPSWTS